MGATFTVQELDKLSMLYSVLRLLSRLFVFIFDEKTDRYW